MTMTPPDIIRILNLSQDALVIVDRGGKIVFGNTQLLALVGYTLDDLVGQPIELLVPDHYKMPHPIDRAGYQLDPQIRPMGTGRDVTIRRRDGTEAPVEIGLSPTSMPGSDEFYTIATIRDNTVRLGLTKDLAASSARTKRASRTATRLTFVAVLTTFLAVVSLVYGLTRPERKLSDPLGGPAYALQQVVSRVPGVQGPAVREAGPVEIKGTLCSDTETDVLTTLQFHGFTNGHSIPGAFYAFAVDEPQHRDQGCRTFTFHNPISDQVRSINAIRRARGQPIFWAVDGFEIPVDRDGTPSGVRKTLTSEHFQIVPDTQRREA